MKKLQYLLFVMSLSSSLMAQSVGIGTEIPDSSAALDISSTTKGMLVPRLTSAQRELIVSPGQGLLVFDITTESFWFHNTSEWVELVDGANVEVHRNGPDKIYMGMTDSVGIGINSPLNKLDIASGGPRSGSHPEGLPLYVTGDLSVDTNGVEFRHNNGTQGIGFGYNTIYATGSNVDQDLGMASRGEGYLYFSTNDLERMRITGSGKVGIGTPTPNAPLQFPNITGRKISLWEVVNNDHQYFGFGINPDGSLRYQVPVNANDHVFYSAVTDTSSNELMRIKGTGNIGIGTNAPSQRLHVAGNAFVDGNVGIRVANPLATLDVVRGTSSEGTARFQGTTYHSNFNYSTEENTFIRGGKSGSHVLLNDLTGLGNVGVGILPVNKLDIRSGSARSGTHPTGLALYVTGDLGASSNGIEFRHYNGTQGIGFGYSTMYAAGSAVNQNLGFTAKGPAGNLLFATNGAERVRINGAGNVMIGTTSEATGHLLSVGGKIAAEEILVDLEADWPDYVFEESYPLLPLEQLKKFIGVKSHLPGVPSAQQVDEHGIYLGEINTILLKKIEELTLYILQQEERIQRLENNFNSK